MVNSLKVLGIESSCDDTAAAVIEVFYKNNEYLKAEINSSVIFNQNQIHNEFGGIVPELAARAHVEKLDLCVETALIKSGTTLNDINIISVTSGPGLIGGLISGVVFAKGLSYGLNKPLIGVNHLVGHALTPRLTHSTRYPCLILIASGGHCQYLAVSGANKTKRLGTTIDDAPGEVFDKVAKMLNLPLFSGSEVEKYARKGDKNRFSFPLPLVNKDDCDFSFSGLKSSVRRQVDRLIEKQSGLYICDQRDITSVLWRINVTVRIHIRKINDISVVEALLARRIGER